MTALVRLLTAEAAIERHDRECQDCGPACYAWLRDELAAVSAAAYALHVRASERKWTVEAALKATQGSQG